MADLAPLLPPSDSSTVAAEPETSAPLPPFDSVIHCLTGGLGWTQFLQYILIAIAWIFDGQQTFINIYTDGVPSWHCSASAAAICNPNANICSIPRSDWSWVGRSDNSIISDWGLECASSFITGLPTSAFFIGCLIGGFSLASLGDSSLGRKNLLVVSLLIMCVTAFVTTFSTNVWIYSILRFISGVGRASVGTCALVLSTETAKGHLRGLIATIGGFCFTIGFVSLPAIAYLNEGFSWRNLYIWTSIPGIFYSALIYFFVLESPRWLLMQGHKEEAIETLERFAPGNHSSLNLLCSQHYMSNGGENATRKKNNVYASFNIIFNRNWALKRLFIITLLAFGIGMVYYSMPLAVGNLGSGIYWSVVFNALSEIPSLVLYFFFVAKWSRRISLLAFSALSGVCSILCAVVSSERKGVLMGLELLSFFSVCVAFSVVVIFGIELFPTNVRNAATSLVRQSLVLGAAFSPVLISAGRKNKIFSYGVFGVVILSCCIFVFCLPETKGATLCDTMEEQEWKEKKESKDGLLV